MKVAVSWSGGMESALACHKVIKQRHDVAYLVVFVSETWPAFCHPLSIMELQAKALGIPLLKLEVKEPYEQSYREAISQLIDKGIEGIVTNKNSVKDLKALAKKTGMDPCGENGEYHTMTIDGPIFKETIEISKFSKEKTDTRLFIKISEYSLKPKNSQSK